VNAVSVLQDCDDSLRLLETWVVHKNCVFRSRSSIIAMEFDIVVRVVDPPTRFTGIENESCVVHSSGKGNKGADDNEGGDPRAEHL